MVGIKVTMQQLFEETPPFGWCFPLNQGADAGREEIQLVGLWEQEGELQLLFLSFDREGWEDDDELYREERKRRRKPPKTCRQELLCEIEDEIRLGLYGQESFSGSVFCSVELAGCHLPVASSCASRIQGEELALLLRFWNSGWRPQMMKTRELGWVSLHRLVLPENREADLAQQVQQLGADQPVRIIAQEMPKQWPVKKRLTLSVEAAPKEVRFQEGETEHEIWIDRVQLYDPWEPEEGETERQRQIRRLMQQFCPEDCALPMVFYEGRENLQLEFYTLEQLRSAPVSNSGDCGFRIRTEQKTGTQGFALRTQLLSPVPKRTDRIPAEILFCWKEGRHWDLHLNGDASR